LQEKIKYYQALLASPDNYKLFKLFQPLVRNYHETKKLDLILTREEEELIGVFKSIETLIFEPLEPVLIFIDQPIKCIAWLKNHILQYDELLHNKTREGLLLLLNSKRVFDKCHNWAFIISEELAAVEYLPDRQFQKIAWMEFFTGSKQFSEYGGQKGFDLMIRSNLQIRGVLKTKSKEVKDYLYENIEEFHGLLKSDEIISFLNDLTYQKDPLHKEKPKKEIRPPQGVKNLKELFIDPELLHPCIDVLKEVFPNLIDGSNNFLKGLKAAFVLWIECLRDKPFIRQITDEHTLAKLLNEYFKGLDISADYFRKTDLGKRAEDKRLDLKTKLSQLAQKES